MAIKEPITTDLAYQIRYNLGLYLPTMRGYVNPRIKEIAIRQQELMAEFDRLDTELKQIYENENQKD